MRIHQEVFTADDADALGGTALDQLEAGGQLDVFITSTQADSRLSIRGPDNEPLAENVFIQQKSGTTSTAPSLQDDPALSLVVSTGGHYTVDINVVTAATIQAYFFYRKAGVDF